MAGNQIEVLKALDAAEIAGTGFFTDSYHKRGSQKHGTLLPNISAAVTGAALCGTLQLFFGWVDDKLGRKRVYGITLMLMAVSAVASVWPAADNCHGNPLLLHILARVWDRGRLPAFHNNHAGIYQHQSHGLFIAAVFNMQGSGIFAIVISAIFDFDGKFKVSKGIS